MLATSQTDAIVLYPDEALRTPAQLISEITDETRNLEAHMKVVLAQCNGLGLAACQVGTPLAMFIYYGPDSLEHTVLNPRITESSGEWMFKEGCLSIPGMFWYITRPKDVLLTGINMEGDSVEVEASDLLGRLFQHEMDHLDGKLLLDRIPKPQAKAAIRKLTSNR